jgi:tetratricopeptide (TPR) repeat protein
MSKRIYVGGLPHFATERDVEALFSSAGAVKKVTLVSDRYTGQAKGFGFVEMSTDAEADAAINMLNGTTMGGRTLTVNEARPRNVHVEAQASPVRNYSSEMNARRAREIFSEALIARSEKNDEKARELFEKAIEISPERNFFDAYAAMERASGNWEKVRQIYSHARRVFPSDVGILENLAMAERKAGNLEKCLEVLQHAVAEAPARLSLHLHLADVMVDWAEQSEQYEILEDAKKHFNYARKISNPITQRSTYKKMWILHQQRSRTAWKLLQKAGFKFERGGIILPTQNQTPVGTWVAWTVDPSEYRYAALYSLDKKILVYCPFRSEVTASDVTQASKLLKEHAINDSDIKQDLLFIILSEVRNLRNHLKGLVEDPESYPTVVPIEEVQAQAIVDDEDAIHRYFNQLLSEWVFQRDLYKGNFPVSGRRFFGREREIGIINQNINDGRSMGIFGLRKSGKTSILKQLQLIRKGDIIAYIDPEASPVSSCSWICWKTVHEWVQGSQSVNRRLNLLRCQSAHKLPDFNQIIIEFSSDVQSLIEGLSGEAKLILMIDEIDKVVPLHGERWEYSLEFFKLLRGIAQQTHGQFVVLVSGANPAICEIPQWGYEDNPVFQFFEEMYLPLLSERQCWEMIVTLGKGMGVEYDETALRSIYEMTGGHPFITRRLCSALVRTQNERPLLVNLKMVTGAEEEFLIQLYELFGEIKSRLLRDYPNEWNLIEAIASGFTYEEIKQLIPDWALALRHLEGYELVERVENKPRIKIKLFHKWLVDEGVK